MDQLINGYKRFRTQGWRERQTLFEKLASKGQQPRALVLGCVDSRADPAMIFDAAPGELLIVRNVANLVPPYAPDQAYHGTSAALEFGVRVLNIPDIVVLGHGQCGGVQALLNGAPEQAQDFIAPWISIAQSAREKAIRHKGDDRQTCCEHEVIKLSLQNLMTFPWIAERVAQGSLRLHGAWFAIHSGILDVLQEDGTFRAVE